MVKEKNFGEFITKLFGKITNLFISLSKRFTVIKSYEFNKCGTNRTM